MSKRKICQGKRCFRSAGAARRSANERGMVPCRVYKCPRCHLHHVTSSKALHADTDQDRRELDPLERLQQAELERVRVDRKVAQAQARNGTADTSAGEWFMDPDAGVPYVDLLDAHNGPGSTVGDPADAVKRALADLEDDSGALAYTPDDQLGKPIVLSPEAFDEFSRAIENPRPPNAALVELMRGHGYASEYQQRPAPIEVRRCPRCEAPIGDRHEDDPLSHVCPNRSIPEPGPRSRGVRMLRRDRKVGS